MKKLFILFGLIFINIGHAQYFQNIFNTGGQELIGVNQLYDGQHTILNYGTGGGLTDYHQVGIGVVRESTNPAIISNPVYPVLSSVKFFRSAADGTVNQNFHFNFTSPNHPGLIWDAEGLSIAEISNTTGNGGYIFCGRAFGHLDLSMLPANQKTQYENFLYGTIDATGVIVSAFMADLGGREIATCIKRSAMNLPGLLTSNRFIMCGYNLTSPSPLSPSNIPDKSNLWVARLSVLPNGVPQIGWTYMYNYTNDIATESSCKAYSCVDYANGNLCIVGKYEQFTTNGTLDANGLLASIDANGVPLLQTSFNIAKDESFRSIIRDDDDLVICGFSQYGPSSSNPNIFTFWGVKLTPAFGVIWNNLYLSRAPLMGPIEHAKAFDLVKTVTDEGNKIYFFSGYFGIDLQLNEIYKIKPDGTPVIYWINELTNVNNGSTYERFINGIDAIPTSKSSPGVVLFSNTFQINQGPSFYKGFHSRVYYNSCRCRPVSSTTCLNNPGERITIAQPPQELTVSYAPSSQAVFNMPLIANITNDFVQQPCSNLIILDGQNRSEIIPNSQNMDIRLSITPNPVLQSNLNVLIDGSAPDQSTDITINSIDGRKLIHTSVIGSKEEQIDVSKLETGMYILIATQNGKQVYTTKFQKF